MSDDNKDKSFVIKFELPQVVNSALTPLAESIGKTLSHSWEGMTMAIETWYGRKLIDHDENLEKYRLLVQRRLSEIDESNLQEPSMNIVGPSLDAAKFYFENEQYREMFSKLISSSCDKSKNPYIHPSFVETIKQLSPLEGKILSIIDLNNPLLIDVINISNDSRKYYGTCPAVIDFFEADFFQLNVAINNLNRLGLISIPNRFGLTPVLDNQEEIWNTKRFRIIKENLDSLISFEHEYSLNNMSITEYGKSFIKVCIG